MTVSMYIYFIISCLELILLQTGISPPFSFWKIISHFLFKYCLFSDLFTLFPLGFSHVSSMSLNCPLIVRISLSPVMHFGWSQTYPLIHCFPLQLGLWNNPATQGTLFIPDRFLSFSGYTFCFNNSSFRIYFSFLFLLVLSCSFTTNSVISLKLCI